MWESHQSSHLIHGKKENIRAVTIHQTHDAVRITNFDPRFNTNLDLLIFLIKHFIHVTFQ